MTVGQTAAVADHLFDQALHRASLYKPEVDQSFTLATYLEHFPEFTSQNFHSLVGDQFSYQDLDEFQVFPMAVEHRMAELDTTWRDLLKEIASRLDWSYAVLWARSDDRRNLAWKQGYYHMRRSDDLHAELFHQWYSKCSFASGFGFAGQLGQASDGILWVTADKFESVPNRVPEQLNFFGAAGIQTVACVPLDLPSSFCVLELGTVSKVLENGHLGQQIKNMLLDIRASGRELLFRDSPVTDLPAESSYGLTMGEVPGHGSLTQQALGSDIVMDSATSVGMELSSTDAARTAAMELCSADPARTAAMDEILQASHRHAQSTIYSELLHPLDQADSFLGQSRTISQISVGLPDLPSSSGLSPRERYDSQWSMGSPPLLPMSPYPSWGTSTIDTAVSGIASASSETSTRLGGPAMEPLEQLLARVSNPQIPQHIAAGPYLEAIRRMSPISSPATRRSQTRDDSAIPAGGAILESYHDRFGVPDLEAASGIHVSGVATSVTRTRSSSTLPTETDSYNWPSLHQSSGTSSKETSPDSNVPISRTSFGIRPAVDVGSSSFSQSQRSLLGKQHSGGMDRLEEPLAKISKQPHEQHAEASGIKLIHSPSDVPADGAAPMLVQFGNVLQLGNSQGQVTEALPQEHDEAAVSHMMAERRRRNKQNENFTQLKSLIPSAAKMDKASLLAATIMYIKELKDRVTTLEESNDTLKRQVDQHQSPKEGPLLRTSSRGKGSPPRPGVRRAPLPYTDAERIQVVPEGDGNLHIEMRFPCNQFDSAMGLIFGCLKDMQFNTINANVGWNDNWILSTVIVKTKRKNSTQAQSEVCAEVEQALKRCVNMI